MMKITKIDGANFKIECGRDELTIFSNALNNIPQAVDECEYTTLIGASKENVNNILNTLVEALGSNNA